MPEIITCHFTLCFISKKINLNDKGYSLVFTNSIKQEWKSITSVKKRCWLLLSGILVLISSLFLNYFVSTWVDSVSKTAVGDLFLDLIPVFELNFLFFWAVFFFWISTTVFLLVNPKQLSFICWSLSLFVLIRCFFISLTHLGPPESAIHIPESLSWFNFSADMFFSGHVGGPFLVALIIESRPIKYLMIVYSMCMVVVVLMAHGHYSIDVFASFFIAHSISVMVKKWEYVFYPPFKVNEE